jgi:opacity protein-like surface antigen
LFPVYENLTIGPSIGLGLAKNEINKDFYLSVMARFRYDVNQITFLGSMHPYAYLDAGLRPTEFNYFGSHFGINPNVGVSYGLNNGGAIDLSVGYAKLSYNDNISKGTLRIALGYKF